MAPLLIVAAASLSAQTKPAAGSNFDPAPSNRPATTATASLPPGQRPSHRADISYTQNQLAVRADNSSLNQILREIGRLTGIKITGGVTEERVFGSYGPAPAPDVLNSLLDGTGSNVLLLAAAGTEPGELILTPRHGGATPPNPNAPGFDDETGQDPDEAPARRNGPGAGVRLFGSPPPSVESGAPTGPTGGVPPSAMSTAPAPATSQVPAPATSEAPEPATTVNQQSPNGVKTPLEIFQQLQQLRQQQQQQQTPPQEP